MSRRPHPNRVWRLRFQLPASAADDALGLLAAAGCAGSWPRPAGDGDAELWRPESEAGEPREAPGGVDDALVDSWFDGDRLPDGLERRLEALGARSFDWRPAEDRDWLEEYRRSALPIRIGRFELDPREPEVSAAEECAEDATEAAVDRLLLPARSAFGTGSHETTRLVVETLQELDLRGRSVLDVGTGTGVLAFVALRLGASSVVAFDLDPVAALLAAQNARLNAAPVRLFAGGVGALSRDEGFDVVLVNVLPENLAGAEREIAKHVGRRGDLFVSGVLSERADEIAARWQDLGLARVSTRVLGEWTGLHLRRDS